MEEKTPAAEYLYGVLVPLLSHPENLALTSDVDERGMLLTIYTHPEDMGRVIGREGKNVDALRTLMRQYGAAASSFISLKVEEPQPTEVPEARG